MRSHVVCRFVRGLSSTQLELNNAGLGIRYLRTSDLLDDLMFKKFDDRYCADPPSDAVYKAEGEMVLTIEGFNRADGRSTVGVPCWRGAGIINNHVVKFEPRTPLLDKRYAEFAHASQSVTDIVRSSAVGAIAASAGPALGDVEIALPPFAQQRAIADFLDAGTARIDALIAMKRRMIELLDERFATQVDQLVLGLRRPDDGALHRGPYPSEPRGWIQTSIRHLGCDVQTGPFGSQLHVDEYIEDGWPLVNPGNLVNGVIRALPNVSVSDEKRDELFRHTLVQGDIVFGRRGQMGRAGLVEAEHVGWLCGTGSLRLRLRDSPVTPEYLKLLLETAPARRYLELGSVGSTMNNLNSDIVLGMPCLVPPADEQHEIVHLVGRLRANHDGFRALLGPQLDLLAELRRALITAAVTGELDIARKMAEEVS